jgi:hypothetical protein
MSKVVIQGEKVVYYAIRFQEGDKEYEYLDMDEGYFSMTATVFPYVWRTDDYELALKMLIGIQKLDLPLLDDDDVDSLADMKFKLMTQTRRFEPTCALQTGAHLATGVMVTFKPNVHIELVSTHLWEGRGPDRFNTTAADYPVSVLVRYPLGYTSK